MNPDTVEFGALGAAFLVMLLGVFLCWMGNSRIRKGTNALLRAGAVRARARKDWNKAADLYQAIRERP